MASPMRFLIQKPFWASGEGFKIASNRFDRFFAISNAQSPMHLVLPLRLAAVGCTLQLTSEEEIDKQLRLLFAATFTLKLHNSDVIV